MGEALAQAAIIAVIAFIVSLVTLTALKPVPGLAVAPLIAPAIALVALVLSAFTLWS